MTYVLVFLAVIGLLYWHKKFNEKIDREEQEALEKDGHALFIRSHYPNLVEEIQELTGWPIGKERDDAVCIKKSDSEYIWLLQHSGQMSVVYVFNKQLVQEWKCPVGTSNTEILRNLSRYVK